MEFWAFFYTFVVFFSIDVKVCEPTSNEVGIVRQSLKKMGLENKEIDDLNEKQLKQLVGKMEEKYEQLRNLSSTEKIIPLLVRGEIEDFEKLFIPPFKLSSKEDLIEDLKISHPNFPFPELIVKSNELGIHYLRWRYIFLKNRHQSVTSIMEILAGVGLSEEAVAEHIALLVEKIPDRTHDAWAKLTVADIKKGLIANGINDDDLINTSLVLFAVRRRKEVELTGELIQKPVTKKP